jgi:hypothetical protein
MTVPCRSKLIQVTTHPGCSLQEIVAAFSGLTRNQIQAYLKQFRSEEWIHPSGPTKPARWFPGPQPEVSGGGRA